MDKVDDNKVNSELRDRMLVAYENLMNPRVVLNNLEIDFMSKLM